MKLYEIETPQTAKKGRCIILSSEVPASLEISGSDVDGLDDDYVLAAGSLLVTPSTNYLAFEDGVFTELE